MRSERRARREQYVRGVPPKISLVLTGIETFATLIIAVILFLGSQGLITDASSMLATITSNMSLLDEFLAIFGVGLESFLSTFMTTLAILLFIYGIWILIFWIICMKSKRRRTRMIVCTVFGRLFGLIIIMLGLAAGTFGPFVIFVFIWVVLNILLASVGWRDTFTYR